MTDKAQSSPFQADLIGGLTTFFTMAYIVVVAPRTLASTGMNFNDAFWAVCLVIAFSTAFCSQFKIR